MKRRKFIYTMGALTGGLLLDKSNVMTASISNFKTNLDSRIYEHTLWNIVREQFIFPKDYAYFNTGGIGAVPTMVVQKVQTSMIEQQLSPQPGHDHKKWIEVKERCARLLGPAVNKEEIALVNSATEGINIILNGLPLRKGDEIISSTHEHSALHVPLLNRMQLGGIKIKIFEPDLQNGPGNVDRIEKLITKRTRLIFISHITCTTGQLFPIKEIGKLAKQNGLWYAVDGAQAIGNVPLDVHDCDIDFYACSGHKWLLGPKRTGILYVKHDLLDTLSATTVGAYSDNGYDISKLSLKLNPTAQRYEYATQNDALFHGLAIAIDFIQTIGLEKIEAHNRALAEQFCAGLKKMPEAIILSPEEEKYRTALITFKINGHDFRDIASHLTEHGMRVRVVPEANVNGIRVSFHIYNNETEVERILNEIQTILS